MQTNGSAQKPIYEHNSNLKRKKREDSLTLSTLQAPS